MGKPFRSAKEGITVRWSDSTDRRVVRVLKVCREYDLPTERLANVGMARQHGQECGCKHRRVEESFSIDSQSLWRFPFWLSGWSNHKRRSHRNLPFGRSPRPRRTSRDGPFHSHPSPNGCGGWLPCPISHRIDGSSNLRCRCRPTLSPRGEAPNIKAICRSFESYIQNTPTRFRCQERKRTEQGKITKFRCFNRLSVSNHYPTPETGRLLLLR